MVVVQVPWKLALWYQLGQHLLQTVQQMLQQEKIDLSPDDTMKTTENTIRIKIILFSTP